MQQVISDPIFGLDPGNKQSALVLFNGFRVLEALIAPNEEIRARLILQVPKYPLVIEKVACYGMAVGESVFETVFWSGIFAESYGRKITRRITRGEIKMHLCHTMRAKDSNVWQALKDRFGEPGKRASPGILYGVTSHAQAALAVAVTAFDIGVGKLSA
jgi:hypothetical protein